MEQDDNMQQSNASMVGGTNGALGGATQADLARGYMTEAPAMPVDDWEMPILPVSDGGFVGRPKGWER